MANLKGSTNVAYVYKLLVCDSSKMFHLAAAQIEKNVYIPHCQSFRVQLRSLRCLLNLMISCARTHLTAASCLPFDGRFGGSPRRDAQEARMHDSSSAAAAARHRLEGDSAQLLRVKRPHCTHSTQRSTSASQPTECPLRPLCPFACFAFLSFPFLLLAIPPLIAA